MGKIEPSPFLSRGLFLALASAALLVLSFPNFNQSRCAWIALVPWLLLLRSAGPRQAFWWSYGIGVLFFLASMWWLIHVTFVGWLLLCAFLALYFGLFGWALVAGGAWRRGARARRRPDPDQLWGRIYFFWCVPALWVTLEYARSHLLSGLGWNLLAYSQAPWRQLIQIADITGVWGVSFIIVLVNVAIAEMGQAILWRKGRRTSDRDAIRTATAHLTCGIAALLVVLGYGSWRISQSPASPAVRVAVVQGNVPQEEKWEATQREAILRRYETLTLEAASTRPQLIVWPETAVPGYLDLDEFVTNRLHALVTSVGIPMLVGAPMGRLDTDQWRMTNSAALLDGSGVVSQRYDKLHLVPFGEFIPFERVMPWLRTSLPPIGDFSPVRRHVAADGAVG